MFCLTHISTYTEGCIECMMQPPLHYVKAVEPIPMGEASECLREEAEAWQDTEPAPYVLDTPWGAE